MYVLLAVAAGGALGAVARFVVSSAVAQWLGAGFPWGILTVNVLGSAIMGALVEIMLETWTPGDNTRAYIQVGLLGAFTTFSSFALDVVTLMQRQQFGLAALYIAASVGLCVGGLWLGMRATRMLLA